MEHKKRQSVLVPPTLILLGLPVKSILMITIIIMIKIMIVIATVSVIMIVIMITV